ncbi:MAG: hypothetical protein N2B06_12400 [Clostridium sp.]
MSHTIDDDVIITGNLDLTGNLTVTGSKAISTYGPSGVYAAFGFGGGENPSVFLNAAAESGAQWRLQCEDGSNDFSIGSDTNSGTLTLGDSTDSVVIPGDLTGINCAQLYMDTNLVTASSDWNNLVITGSIAGLAGWLTIGTGGNAGKAVVTAAGNYLIAWACRVDSSSSRTYIGMGLKIDGTLKYAARGGMSTLASQQTAISGQYLAIGMTAGQVINFFCLAQGSCTFQSGVGYSSIQIIKL